KRVWQAGQMTSMAMGQGGVMSGEWSVVSGRNVEVAGGPVFCLPLTTHHSPARFWPSFAHCACPSRLGGLLPLNDRGPRFSIELGASSSYGPWPPALLPPFVWAATENS